jgi:hypothetical protein
MTQTIENLIAELKSRGMCLEPHRGGLRIVHDRGALQPEFAATLRHHKSELLAWLNVEHTAKQIMLGEFTSCDNATAQNLVRLLKSANNPAAKKAVEYLLTNL